MAISRFATASALTLLGAAALGCSSEVEGSGGGGTGGAGGGAGGGASTLSCPAPWTRLTGHLAAVADAGSTCLETEARIAVDVCVTDVVGTGWLACFRQREDGRRIWLGDDQEVRLDETVWELCPEQDNPPPPCFTGSCAFDPPVAQAGVVSNCTEAETRERFFCGEAESLWDESCCARAPCVDGACQGGLGCGVAFSSSYQYCRESLTNGACSCGGTADAQGHQVCFPE